MSTPNQPESDSLPEAVAEEPSALDPGLETLPDADERVDESFTSFEQYDSPVDDHGAGSAEGSVQPEPESDAYSAYDVPTEVEQYSSGAGGESEAHGSEGGASFPTGLEFTHRSRRRRTKSSHMPPPDLSKSQKRRRKHGHSRDKRPLSTRPWFMIATLLLCLGAAVAVAWWMSKRDVAQGLNKKLGSSAAASKKPGVQSAFTKLPTAEERRKASDLLDEALKSRTEGNIDATLNAYREIQDKYPWVEDFTLDGAIMLLAAKRAPDALVFANTSIQKGIDLAAAQIAVGLIAQSEEKLDASALAFEEAHYADPFSADVLFYWSEALRKIGRSAEAAEKLEGAVLRSTSASSLYLFTIKLRLAKLEAEGMKMNIDEIQATLDNMQLPAEDYLCASALTLQAGEIPATRELLVRAGSRLPPTFFSFLLGDPLFSTVVNHPEIIDGVRQVLGERVSRAPQPTSP
jgi:hypothetical protein